MHIMSCLTMDISGSQVPKTLCLRLRGGRNSSLKDGDTSLPIPRGSWASIPKGWMDRTRSENDYKLGAAQGLSGLVLPRPKVRLTPQMTSPPFSVGPPESLLHALCAKLIVGDLIPISLRPPDWGRASTAANIHAVF